MTREDRIDGVKEAARRVAESYRLDLFDVQWRRESRGWVLRVILDRPWRPGAPADESVSVSDCQRVSEDLGAILDVEELLDRQYTLEVSSPGLDRPLRGADDYRRFAGRLAKIVVSQPVDGQMHLAGRLGGLEGEVVLLEAARGRVHRIPLAVVSRARLDVEF